MKTDNQRYIIVALLFFILGGFTGSYFSQQSHNVRQESYAEQVTTNSCDRDLTRDNLLIKVNETRLANGLPQMLTRPDIEAFANKRLKELKETGMTHVSDLTRPSFGGTQVSEILAETYTEGACGPITVWLESPTHKDALLDPDNKLIGLATDGKYSIVLMID